MYCMKFLSPEVALYLYNFTILALHGILLSGLVLLVTTWNCLISYKNGYVGLFVIDCLLHLNSWLIVEM